MAVEITVGPPQLAIHQGFTVFVTEPNGGVAWPSEKGLYFNDTRLISAYAVYANGQPWSLLNSGAPVFYGCRVFLSNQAFLSEGGEVKERTLSLVLSRTINGGLHEAHEITNYGHEAVDFNYEVSIRSDFADVFEAKIGRIVRRGRISSTWSNEKRELSTSYRNKHFHRGVRIRVAGDAPAFWVNGRLTFSVRLEPGQT